VNGSGKTSVLDAVGMLLKMIINLDGLFTINFQKSDISVESTEGNTEIYFLSEDSEKGFNAKICVPEKGYSLEVNSKNSHEYSSSNHFQSSYPEAEEKISKTVISYYQTNRRLVDNQTNKTSESFYNNHCFSISNFNDFLSWFKEEYQIKTGEQSNDVNPKLAAIEMALNRFFSKLEGDIYSNLSFNSTKELEQKPIYDTSSILIEKNKILLKFDQLSNGERSIILLISDIVGRLIIANPDIPIEEVLNQFGFILIDKIELHLHPAWQRNIMPALTHTFPNVQFLLTTHSPLVLSNVRKECVHIIKDFARVPSTPPIYGADNNMILWDIFGVKERPKHAEDKFNEYYRALETKDRDTALKLLEGLQQHFGEGRLDVRGAKISFEFEFDEYLA